MVLCYFVLIHHKMKRLSASDESNRLPGEGKVPFSLRFVNQIETRT
jgi:hypothetical protein